MNTLLYLTWRASKDLLSSTGKSAQCHVAAWMGENGYVYNIYCWVPFLCTWNYHNIISWLWKWKSLSRVRLFATPWTIRSMEFSKPEFWSREPFPSPGDLPDLVLEPRSPVSQADSLPAEPPGWLWKWSESEFGQSCPTLCDPMDCSPPGSTVHGIFQARVLESVAVSFSRGSSRPRAQTQVLCIAGRCFYRQSHQGPYTLVYSNHQVG